MPKAGRNEGLGLLQLQQFQKPPLIPSPPPSTAWSQSSPRIKTLAPWNKLIACSFSSSSRCLKASISSRSRWLVANSFFSLPKSVMKFGHRPHVVAPTAFPCTFFSRPIVKRRIHHLVSVLLHALFGLGLDRRFCTLFQIDGSLLLQQTLISKATCSASLTASSNFLESSASPADGYVSPLNPLIVRNQKLFNLLAPTQNHLRPVNVRGIHHESMRARERG
jgi:hypothetical protein